MSLSIGIVGLPNVGKSTLFKALTKKEVLIANYPFATIDPSVGVVEVPDGRLDKLAEFSKSAKKIPAVVEFVDIAGLVRGANKGEGLGNQFLANIREVDAVLYVVRAFEEANIRHVENKVDPVGDFEILKTELMLKDLETVEKHAQKVRKEARAGGKEAAIELELLGKVTKGLEGGVMAQKIFEEVSTEREKTAVEKLRRELQLLTAKRGILLFNTSNGGGQLAPYPTRQQARSGSGSPDEWGKVGFPAISMNIREELEGAGFSDDERKELGLSAAKLPELVRIAYEHLGLITFFTTGEDETRAWTTKKGASAPEAAGVIHTDFEEKFIRADVIAWDKLLESGSWPQAKSGGAIKTVGKDYKMRDGDVMEVKHGA